MAVRIRMKRMGRRHRPFYRICAVDQHGSRDGKVIEELGTYDPVVPDTDARAVLCSERIDYWLSVGALPSDKVKVLIKKYGSGGTHLDLQKVALEKLAQPREIPDPGPPATRVQSKAEVAAAAAAEAEPEAAASASEEAPAEAVAKAPAEAAGGGEAEASVAEPEPEAKAEASEEKSDEKKEGTE